MMSMANILQGLIWLLFVQFKIKDMPTKSYKRVYVWEMPVRIFHWLNALSIVVLAITGFIIGDPPAFMAQTEAWNTFLFGYVKVIHFISGFVFFGVMVGRVYWSFVGNKYAHWTAFIPLNKNLSINKKAFRNMIHVVKHDILLLEDKKHRLSDISIGHNFMATSAYVVMFFVGIVLVFTGFGLYSDLSGWWLPKLFSWVPDFLGGDFATRQIHRVSMWLILVFIILHVYLALFHDWLHARGEISTMISGFKFVRTERVKKEEEKTGVKLEHGEGLGYEVDYEDEVNYDNDKSNDIKIKEE